MKPYYDHVGITIYLGDALEKLKELPDNIVQCCVTSPPYWGLRDYGTGKWIGGNQNCEHKVRESQNPVGNSTLSGGKETVNHSKEGFKVYCPRCGAIRADQQIGLEKTPEEYVEKMVEIFREVRRVLKSNGVMFLNLGDTYSCGKIGRTDNTIEARSNLEKHGHSGMNYKAIKGNNDGIQRKVPLGLKPKDLVGIPWLTAFALRNDGWYLRSSIIWNKQNPMPESVTDRPTKSYEHIFLMAKSEKYYYDGDVIKERSQYRIDKIPSGWDTGPNAHNKLTGRYDNKFSRRNDRTQESSFTRRKQYDSSQGGGGTSFIGHSGNKKADGTPICGLYRNKRDVWTVPACPYKEAHFATYPPDLIKPCILAGSPVGGVILDPFLGSGTTAYVSKELNRKCIGIELNEEYIKIATKRLSQEVMELS
jgi:DNA modification methylase